MLKTIIKNTIKFHAKYLVATALLGASLFAYQVAIAQSTEGDFYHNHEYDDESASNTINLKTLKLVNIYNSTIRISDEPGLGGKMLCESVNNANAEDLGDPPRTIGSIQWMKVRVLDGNCTNTEGWVSINNTKMP